MPTSTTGSKVCGVRTPRGGHPRAGIICTVRCLIGLSACALSLLLPARPVGALDATVGKPVQIQFGNVFAPNGLAGNLSMQITDGTGKTQKLAIPIDVLSGDEIASPPEFGKFTVSGAGFDWAVELRGSESQEDLLLRLEGKALMTGRAWYTVVLFKDGGRIEVKKGREQVGLVTVRFAIVRARAFFEALAREPAVKEYQLMFALDYDGDGQFTGSGTHLLDMSSVGAVIAAAIPPLSSIVDKAGFQLEAKSKDSGKTVVRLQGAWSFPENTAFGVDGWFDTTELVSIQLKLANEKGEMVIALPPPVIPEGDERSRPETSRELEIAVRYSEDPREGTASDLSAYNTKSQPITVSNKPGTVSFEPEKTDGFSLRDWLKSWWPAALGTTMVITLATFFLIQLRRKIDIDP